MPSTELTPLDEEGKLILVLEVIIDTKERTLHRRKIKEYLVKWRNLLVEDATWECDQILQYPKLKFLEGKQFWDGRTVISPS